MKKINWKYAIGELIIVILGITIAFSLNNWKESRAGSRLRTQYLENMRTDIEAEIIQLHSSDSLIQGKLQSIQQIRPFLGRNGVRRDTIASKVFDLARLVSFDPENTTYQVLINSGDLKLINDLQLRRNIEEHYALHSSVLKDYERIEEIHRKYVADFFMSHVDFEKIRLGDADFLDHPQLRNIINSLEGAFFLVLQANARCMRSDSSLLSKITIEIH